MREGYEGTGPGAITPDGCAVEVYLRLPVNGEPEVVAAAAPAGARVLELGCGAGRVTHPLVERGFEVTAVDESEEMLARVQGARTVCAPIELLDLGEQFDVVLLGSFLVHAGDPETRRGLLRACRRHVASHGKVLIQREGADYHSRVPRERVDPRGHTVRVLRSDPLPDGVRSVHVAYEFPDGSWTQTFRSRPLTDAEFTEVLAREGLAIKAQLTPDGIWWEAEPVPPGACGPPAAEAIAAGEGAGWATAGEGVG